MVCEEAAYTLQGQERQRRTQMRFLIIFERVDHIPNGPFIEEACPGRIKMRWMSQTGTTAVVATCPGKWHAADWAER